MTHNTAENYALKAAVLSEKASQKGTFGVGGLLVDKNGVILKEMENRVVEDGIVRDPTAHVERQIVDWYYEQIRAGKNLPPPRDLTIVSTLDPCMMCAGSILAAGFNVVSMNYDDFAGINHDHSASFQTVPTHLKMRASETFGYFGVFGKRPYQGAKSPAFGRKIISTTVQKKALTAFTDSLLAVRDTINGIDINTIKTPKNPLEVFAGNRNTALFQKIRKIAPDFLAVTGDPDHPPEITVEMADHILKAARDAQRLLPDANSDTPAANAAALIDPFGNLLTLMPSAQHISPIRTAFMKLTRQYAHMRQKAGTDAAGILPHLKYCKIVTLYGPGKEAHDIADIGAYGSSVEGPLPAGSEAHMTYILSRQPQEELDKMIKNFPPLYSQNIGVNIRQVNNSNVTEHCRLRSPDL